MAGVVYVFPIHRLGIGPSLSWSGRREGEPLKQKAPGTSQSQGLDNYEQALQAVVSYFLDDPTASVLITRSASSFDGLKYTFGLGGIGISTSGINGLRPIL